MTSFLTQFSPVQIWHYALTLLGSGQEPEALMTSDAASSPKNNLTEEQLMHVHEIMQQKDDNNSKAKDLEKPSPQIISDTTKATAKPVVPKLPASIYVQSIFPNLRLDEVKEIRLVSKPVKGQAIQSIRFRSKLTWQEIKDFLEAGGDLKTLANVKAIGGAGDYEVTDDDIEQICHLPNLEKIDLRGCYQLTDRAYIALGKHASKLTSCDASAPATNAGIEALAMGCKNLSRINLRSCFQLDDKAYKALGKYASELTYCDLSGAEITNAGVEALASGCKKLSEINLSFCRKIDAGALIALGANAFELTSLDASNTKIVSKEGIENLAIGCKKLAQIIFRGCSIDDDDLATLGTHAHNLTNFDVSFTYITSEGVEALAKGCKRLSKIDLQCCNNIDDRALIALGTHASELTDCNVGGQHMHVTNAGIKALASGCQKLSKINLSCCPKIDDGAFIALGANAHELTSCVADNVKVTNSGVIALIKTCKKLSEIDFSCCRTIDDEVLKIFQDDVLALRQWNIFGTNFTKDGIERFNANRKHRVAFT